MNTQLLIGALVLGLLVFFGVNYTNERVTDEIGGEIQDEETSESPEEQVTEPSQEVSSTVRTGGNTIDLSGNGLSKVPEHIFTQTNIEVLDLSNNNLSGALPAEVGRLQGLRELDLSNNNFTGVPAEIGRLRELEVLNLSNNPITGLPYELGNLKKLKRLDLRGTQYSEHDLNIIEEGLSNDVIISR